MEFVKTENFAETFQTGMSQHIPFLPHFFSIFIFPSSHAPKADFKENQIKRNLFEI